MGTGVSSQSPKQQFIQAGRKIRDALKDMRDLVRRRRKADPYNEIFSALDEHVENATDALIVMANTLEQILRPGAEELHPTSNTDLMNLHELQQSLAEAKAERDELVENLQSTQEQLERYAADLQVLYSKERQKRYELAEAYRQLQAADQLKANFLSTINHELTSPLVPLDLSLQILEKGSLDDDQRTTVHGIKDKLVEYKRQLDGVIKYADLVNQTHVVSRDWMDLYTLVDTTLQPLYRLAEARRINIRVDEGMQGMEVYADADLLGSLTYQLVHNAIKFNRVGGQVQVDAKSTQDGITMRFMDDGPGIPERILEHFGEDFNQTVEALKRGTEGLGLGLALSNYVAGVHGGKLTAENGTQKGALITLWLPPGVS
ncbi:MAG: HAMP domain-containing histidine kinase [Anaerolineae bacterium]|nr:MAG: HAMP domain-containing histidine kinase [Anaerolineae bacterium]